MRARVVSFEHDLLSVTVNRGCVGIQMCAVLCSASSVAVVDILHLINIRGVALVNK